MKDYIEQRVTECAEFILQCGATVRCCAKQFCVSKSTVHKDVAERLAQLDKALFAKVKAVLGENLAQRHIRGGQSTKRKYGAK